MMVSTKGRYALRVMLDLAARTDLDEVVSLADISQRQEISRKYLEAIVAALYKEGFVESRRGKAGGYRLSRPASEYTVLDILTAAEGNFSPVSCPECDGGECERAASCLTLPVWKELDRRIDEYLAGVTLADVLVGLPRPKTDKNEDAQSHA